MIRTPLSTALLHEEAATAASPWLLAPWLLVLALGLLGIALALAVRSKERRELLQSVAKESGPRRGRFGYALLLALAFGLRLGFGAGIAPLGLELAAASAAGLALWLLPSEADRVLGQAGVRVGYHVRRFAVLEEWRLSGDHLRLRLFGEWTAVRVPPEAMAGLRADLEREAKDRESRFGN
jgi:hypothetical protein